MPSLARDASGRIWAAFQWFAESGGRWDEVGVQHSDDGGRTWSAARFAEFVGLPQGMMRPMDPTLVPLPDGRMRMYFTSDPAGGRLWGPSTGIYSAVSEDGVRFTFEPGVRFAVSGSPVIDSTVARLGDRWHLVAAAGASQGAYHATSEDGLAFTRTADPPSFPERLWVGTLMTEGDRLRFVGTSQGTSAKGAWTSTSEDGIAWSAPLELGLRAADPAVLRLPDGTWMLVVVTAR